MPAELDQADFTRAIARIPRWILLLALVGTVFTLARYDLPVAGGYLLGAIAAWVNYRLIERVATRVTRVGPNLPKAGRGTGVALFIRFTALVLGALAILILSGFSRLAAFCGFLITPAAVILEMVFELVTFRH